MSKNRGFTLIELMVVLAIVGILMAIAVPAFNEQLRKSRRSEALEGLASIVTQQENWRTNHATYAVAQSNGSPPTAGIRMPAAVKYYNFAITANSASAWTATATPIAGSPQANDRCGTYTFAVDNAARPGQPPRKSATGGDTCF